MIVHDANANKVFIDDFDDFVRNLIKPDDHVLDIGTGTGKFLYRLYHKHSITKLKGIETKRRDDIEKNSSLHSQLIENENVYDFLESGPYPLNSFDFYQLYVSQVLNSQPLDDESNYKKTFLIQYETPFDKKLFSEEKFDFIILSKVLHYTENPEQFIVDCLSILKKNGKIYITFPTNSGRTIISPDDFNRILNNTKNFGLVALDGPKVQAGPNEQPNIIFKGYKTL